MPDHVHQIGRVVAVVDGEGGIEPDLVGIFAKEPGADTVERTSPTQRTGHDSGAATHKAVLDEVHRTGVLPRAAATSLATKRVHRAMQTRRWDATIG